MKSTLAVLALALVLLLAGCNPVQNNAKFVIIDKYGPTIKGGNSVKCGGRGGGPFLVFVNEKKFFELAIGDICPDGVRE